MLTIKNWLVRASDGEPRASRPGCLLQAFVVLPACVALLAGCTPPGPRALLDGKKLIEQGKYPKAIEKLKTATSLLSTNAQAFNYLGLACHQAGLPADAERAYQRSLTLNPDLLEARYNLGCLLLAQGKLEPAEAQFTAYTLRRGTSADGWLKLGAVQLRQGELAAGPARSSRLAAAEKSFSEALRSSPQNPEALTGLGLVRVKRGHASEAPRFFNAALKQQRDYRPALLNLAIVAQEYLKDRPLALQKYREYLALKPAPEDAGAVSALVRQLEQETLPAPVPAGAPAQPVVAPSASKSLAASPPRAAGSARPSATNAARIAAAAGPEVPAAAPKPAGAANTAKLAAAVAPPPNPEMVQLEAEPVIRPAQDAPLTSASPAKGVEPKPVKRSLLQRLNPVNLLSGEDKHSARLAALSSATNPPAAETAAAARSEPGQPGSRAPARYANKSFPQPVPGDRAEAERAFAQGLQAQRAQHLPEALQAYRRATQLDPSFFDAHYNLGLAASEAGNAPLALAAYENALAVRPDSLDARYNLALQLKQANYTLDAVNELDRILAFYPNDSRTHLALGNLYAQQLRQPAKARLHYLKALEADPSNPQAGAIRYWLADNPR